MPVSCSFRLVIFAALAVACALPAAIARETSRETPALLTGEELPARLSETGLYLTDTRQLRPEPVSYTPQYPLWSDGATKRRWMYLPPGKTIDATDVDAWVFPPGTRFWKEFSHGRAVETRFIERTADGSWRYATYVWDEDGRDATLAPERGIARWPAAGAPDGIYAVPSREDCRACHEGAAVPVLGVGALQLSPDRDPGAPNAETPGPEDVDLTDLIDRGLLVNYPPAGVAPAPAVRATTPTARAALGYLHANCGHCHNARGPLADIGLLLAQETSQGFGEETLLRSMLGVSADARMEGIEFRLLAGQPDKSQLAARMKSRNPLHQMPPLGSRRADEAALRLIESWVRTLSSREGNTS